MVLRAIYRGALNMILCRAIPISTKPSLSVVTNCHVLENSNSSRLSGVNAVYTLLLSGKGIFARVIASV